MNNWWQLFWIIIGGLLGIWVFVPLHIPSLGGLVGSILGGVVWIIYKIGKDA